MPTNKDQVSGSGIDCRGQQREMPKDAMPSRVTPARVATATGRATFN